MKNLVLSQMALTLVIGLALSSESLAQRHSQQQQPPGYTVVEGYPNQMRPQRPGYYEETIQIQIGRVIQNEVLPLRRLGRIDERYNGFEVVAVTGYTRPVGPYSTQAYLVGDRSSFAQQFNPDYQLNLIPNPRMIIGETVRTVQLDIRGALFVDIVYVTLRQRIQPPPPPPHKKPPPTPPRKTPHSRHHITHLNLRHRQ